MRLAVLVSFDWGIVTGGLHVQTLEPDHVFKTCVVRYDLLHNDDNNIVQVLSMIVVKETMTPKTQICFAAARK